VIAARELRNFVLIGGIGFVIDATILMVLTRLFGWAPWYARIPSFLTAVLVTWVLNRRHTFPGRGPQRRSTEAFFYIVIQICGAAINLAVFGACLYYAAWLRTVPVIPLAIGAVGGLAWNFAAARLLLYARRRPHAST
jgi:putative flippase GtrA